MANRTGRPKGVSNVRWTVAKREAFLDHLAVNCNVSAAAAAIDVHRNSVMVLRRRDPEFAAAWHEAIQLGYDMLETRLLAHALAGGADKADAVLDGIGETPVEPVNVEMAHRLLTSLRHAKNKPHQRTPMRYATRDETDKVLLAKLAQLSKRRREIEALEAERARNEDAAGKGAA